MVQTPSRLERILHNSFNCTATRHSPVTQGLLGCGGEVGRHLAHQGEAAVTQHLQLSAVQCSSVNITGSSLVFFSAWTARNSNRAGNSGKALLMVVRGVRVILTAILLLMSIIFKSKH